MTTALSVTSSFAGHWRDQWLGAIFEGGNDVTDSDFGAAGNCGFALAELKLDFFFVIGSNLDDVVVAFFPGVGNTGNFGQVGLTLWCADFEQLFDTAQTLGSVVGDGGTGTVLGVQ